MAQATVEEQQALAQEGDAAATYGLGQCYYYGNGLAKDYAQAVALYRRTTEKAMQARCAIWVSATTRALASLKIVKRRSCGTCARLTKAMWAL